MKIKKLYIKKTRFSNSGYDNWIISGDDGMIVKVIGIDDIVKYKLKNIDDVKKYLVKVFSYEK